MQERGARVRRSSLHLLNGVCLSSTGSERIRFGPSGEACEFLGSVCALAGTSKLSALKFSQEPFVPELPEVETMVRGVRPFVEGRTIRELVACDCPCKPLNYRPQLSEIAARMAGQKITAVKRRAKRAILELENGDALVIEPRMTGLLLLSDPPDPGHLRLEWKLSGKRQFNSLWFWDRRGLGTVTLYENAEYQSLVAEGYLGRDALEMVAGDWAEKVAKSRRAIKVLLLDQSVAAGIGNLYASEILHFSRIHPETPSDSLSRSQVNLLAQAVKEILETAILHEGSTLSDGTYRNALNQSGGYQNAHKVYDRAGEVCLTCQVGVVERIVQTQRSTFFCAKCQRKKR
jgi:formamidopyrimidine-DNA glycosylase